MNVKRLGVFGLSASGSSCRRWSGGIVIDDLSGGGSEVEEIITLRDVAPGHGLTFIG